MSEEVNENRNSQILNFNLRKDYFINKNSYFQNLLSQCPVESKGFIKSKKICQSLDFGKRIEEENILFDFFTKAKNNIENENIIEILKNGLFFYDKKILLYCKKDEETEDKFLCNINNIKCIDHLIYDQQKNDLINEENISFKSNSKYKNDFMTGLKNRALVLESIVNYFFMQFPIVPLPNLIFNLDYSKKAKKSDTSINLFFEWDGCYILDNGEKNDISFGPGLSLPFHNEMKYKITKKKTEAINNNILIKKDSIILIEVKTHFPKEIEEDKNNNLENIIKVMFTKLNYFIYLYSKILLIKAKEIKIILLYDQNRLINYKNNIIEYIDKYKNNFTDIDTYELYFDILYIIPYISKLSLNNINNKLLEANKRIEKLEENNKRIQKLEEENKRIKILEENNKRIQKLEEENEKFKNELALIKLQLSQLKQNKIEEDEKSSIKKDKYEKIEMKNILVEKEKNDIPKKTENVTPEYKNKITKIYANILTQDEILLNENNENTKKIDTDKNSISTPSKIIKIKQIKNNPQTNMKNDINEKISLNNQEKLNDNQKIEENKKYEQEINEIKIKNYGVNLNQNESKSEYELKKDNKQKVDESKKDSKNDNEIIPIKLVNIQKKENISIRNKKSKVEIQDEKILNKKLDISDISKNGNKNQSEIGVKNRNGNVFIADNIYRLIHLKINNNEKLLEKEKVYKLMYENCRKELNIESFSLMEYKTNHCSGDKSTIKDAFHKALKELTKKQRKLFFSTYRFIPCMTVCYELI